MKEKLEEAARDPAGERVRVEAQDLIGTVKLIEEGEHIIAELEGARLLMQGGTTHVTHGAQEAACMLRHRIDCGDKRDVHSILYRHGDDW